MAKPKPGKPAAANGASNAAPKNGADGAARQKVKATKKTQQPKQHDDEVKSADAQAVAAVAPAVAPAPAQARATDDAKQSNVTKPEVMAQLPKDVAAFIKSKSPAFTAVEIKAGGKTILKVRCNLTNHEMPPRMEVIKTYMETPKYKKDAEWYSVDYSEHEPWLVASTRDPRKLWCTLSRKHVNRIPKDVQMHVHGKKFNRLKAAAIAKAEEDARRKAAKAAGGEPTADDIESKLEAIGAFEDSDDEEEPDPRVEKRKRRFVNAAADSDEDEDEDEEDDDEDGDDDDDDDDDQDDEDGDDDFEDMDSEDDFPEDEDEDEDEEEEEPKPAPKKKGNAPAAGKPKSQPAPPKQAKQQPQQAAKKAQPPQKAQQPKAQPQKPQKPQKAQKALPQPAGKKPRTK